MQHPPDSSFQEPRWCHLATGSARAASPLPFQRSLDSSLSSWSPSPTESSLLCFLAEEWSANIPFLHSVDSQQYSRFLAGTWYSCLLTLNISGVDIFARVQIPVVFGLMGILAIMGLAGVFGFTSQPRVDSPILNTDWGTLASMGAVAIWLYIGMEFVAPLTEEVHRPWKTIPTAMIVGVCTIFVVDVLFGWGATRYADLAEMASSSIPHVVGATAIFGATGGLIMTVVTILASFSTGNSYLAAIPRMLYGLANEGLLPRWFAKVSRRTRVPWVGMLVTAGCMASVLLYSTFSQGGIELILNLISIACVTWLFSYIIAQIDVIVLRRRYPSARRPFKTPLYPLPQVLGIASCVYLIVFIVPDMEQRLVIWASAGIILLAIAVFAVIWLKRNRLPLFTPTDLTHTQNNITVRSESLGHDDDEIEAAAAAHAKSETK